VNATAATASIVADPRVAGLGKLYICAIKDVCSRKIVGYAIDARMTSHLADAALRTAIARRAPAGTVVVHSDRGGQFRSHR
jgi:putative transposase